MCRVWWKVGKALKLEDEANQVDNDRSPRSAAAMKRARFRRELLGETASNNNNKEEEELEGDLEVIHLSSDSKTNAKANANANANGRGSGHGSGNVSPKLAKSPSSRLGNGNGNGNGHGGEEKQENKDMVVEWDPSTRTLLKKPAIHDANLDPWTVCMHACMHV